MDYVGGWRTFALVRIILLSSVSKVVLGAIGELPIHIVQDFNKLVEEYSDCDIRIFRYSDQFLFEPITSVPVTITSISQKPKTKSNLFPGHYNESTRQKYVNVSILLIYPNIEGNRNLKQLFWDYESFSSWDTKYHYNVILRPSALRRTPGVVGSGAITLMQKNLDSWIRGYKEGSIIRNKLKQVADNQQRVRYFTLYTLASTGPANVHSIANYKFNDVIEAITVFYTPRTPHGFTNISSCVTKEFSCRNIIEQKSHMVSYGGKFQIQLNRTAVTGSTVWELYLTQNFTSTKRQFFNLKEIMKHCFNNPFKIPAWIFPIYEKKRLWSDLRHLPEFIMRRVTFFLAMEAFDIWLDLSDLAPTQCNLKHLQWNYAKDLKSFKREVQSSMELEILHLVIGTESIWQENAKFGLMATYDKYGWSGSDDLARDLTPTDTVAQADDRKQPAYAIPTGSNHMNFVTCHGVSQPVSFSFYAQPYTTIFWVMFLVSTFLLIPSGILLLFYCRILVTRGTSYRLKHEALLTSFGKMIWFNASLGLEVGVDIPNIFTKDGISALAFLLGLWSLLTVVLVNAYKGIISSSLTLPPLITNTVTNVTETEGWIFLVTREFQDKFVHGRNNPDWFVTEDIPNFRPCLCYPDVTKIIPKVCSSHYDLKLGIKFPALLDTCEQVREKLWTKFELPLTKPDLAGFCDYYGTYDVMMKSFVETFKRSKIVMRTMHENKPICNLHFAVNESNLTTKYWAPFRLKKGILLNVGALNTELMSREDLVNITKLLSSCKKVAYINTEKDLEAFMTVAHRTQKHINFVIGEDRLYHTTTGILMHQNRPSDSRVYRKLLELMATGIYHIWEKWYRIHKPNLADKILKNEGSMRNIEFEPKRLHLHSNINTGFIVLSIFILLSAFTFLVELALFSSGEDQWLRIFTLSAVRACYNWGQRLINEAIKGARRLGNGSTNSPIPSTSISYSAKWGCSPLVNVRGVWTMAKRVLVWFIKFVN